MWSSRHRQSHTASSTTAPIAVPDLTKDQLKLATRTRKIIALLTSVSLSITVLFLILTEIGSTYNKPIIRDWYFIRIDLSHIIPKTVPNFALINTIAQTLGLHDFYQVGLWGFCEGYMGSGVTECSSPKGLYWFNPVEILRDELLAGASIDLPPNINDILSLIRIASHLMSTLFLTSACLSTVLIPVAPLAICTRWLSLPLAIFTFLNALFVTAASIIATVMFVIFRNVISSVAELNIGAEIGDSLFAFMWIGCAFAIFAWMVQTGLCCCCASRRDVKTGRKRGDEKAYQTDGDGRDGVVPNVDNEANSVQDKRAGRRRFPFGKRSV